MGLQRSGPAPRGLPGRARQHRAIEGAFSEIEYGGHNQTLRYDGIISPNWLIEASVGPRRPTSSTEIPASQRAARSPTCRFVPVRASTRRHRLPATTTDGQEPPVPAEVHQHLQRGRQPPAPLRRPVRGHRVHPRHRPGPGRPSPSPTAAARIGGAPVQVRDRRGGRDVLPRHPRPTRPQPASPPRSTSTSSCRTPGRSASSLTLRPGLRWERQKLTGVEPGVDGAPDLCFDDDTRPGAGDGSGAAIPCTFTWDDNWAPAPRRRPTTSRATAGPSSTRPGAGSTPRSRTTSPPAPCPPTPASPARTTSTPP